MLPETITQKFTEIPAKVAQKLDDSPKVVNNWRDLWKARSVQLNALGAFLSFIIGTAVWVSPLFGVLLEIALPLGVTLTIACTLFVLAVIARYTTQKPPDDEDDPTKDNQTHG
jgi:VIT1/CCC1 family predicted Fe2+/Mn2+ transporter